MNNVEWLYMRLVKELVEKDGQETYWWAAEKYDIYAIGIYWPVTVLSLLALLIYTLQETVNATIHLLTSICWHADISNGCQARRTSAKSSWPFPPLYIIYNTCSCMF